MRCRPIGAVALSLALQVAVIYVPLSQRAFDTVPLQGRDWLTCVLVASSVLWLRELSKAAWHLGNLAAFISTGCRPARLIGIERSNDSMRQMKEQGASMNGYDVNDIAAIAIV